jgi:uncharacterized protein (TIGR03663 family)
MRGVAIVCCWIVVAAVGGWLRFDGLGERPFHADEATGAKITAKRMELADYRFDPTHFHGPLFSGLAIPFCKAAGQTRWDSMEKGTLRLLPAVAGILLVLVPLLGRRRWGDAPMLLAAAMLATSPLLVYYGRMFIHESLLALFGVLVVLTLFLNPRHGAPGVLLGLMFATKETFAISLMAWVAAGLLLAVENLRLIDRERVLALWRDWWLPLALSAATALFVSLVIYTDWFRHLQGAADAVRTFFVYRVTEGHEKPFGYYAGLLLMPRRLADVGWFEGLVLVFAAAAYAASFGRSPTARARRPVVRFLAYSALGHFLIYSLIAYKTPWLAVLPWAHVCLLAGFAAAGWPEWKVPLRTTLAVLVAGTLAWQSVQARRATGRLASNPGNPYAYVPTSEDIESLVPWLREVGGAAPDIPLRPVAVIGTGYWPLPWYLRRFEQVGYWEQPETILEKLDRFPLVFAAPDTTDRLLAGLAETHSPVPVDLRSEVPVTVFIRNDVFVRWLER